MSKAFSRGSVLLFISRRIAQSHLAFMLVFVTIPTQYISHSLASFLASAPICEPHIHTTPSQTQLNNNIITDMLFSCRRHFGSVSKNSSKAGRRAMCNFWMHGTKGERHESWTRFFFLQQCYSRALSHTLLLEHKIWRRTQQAKREEQRKVLVWERCFVWHEIINLSLLFSFFITLSFFLK